MCSQSLLSIKTEVLSVYLARSFLPKLLVPDKDKGVYGKIQCTSKEDSRLHTCLHLPRSTKSNNRDMCVSPKNIVEDAGSSDGNLSSFVKGLQHNWVAVSREL